MSERDRAASRLQRTQGRASALAAQRTALGQIATAIARGQRLEHVLELVARHAATLLDAATAELSETTGTPTTPWPPGLITMPLPGRGGPA